MRNLIKILCIVLSMLLCFSFVACNKDNTPSEPVASEPPASEPEPEPIKLNINPLTGLETLTDEEVEFRPVAVAVNNIGVAQSIQSGIDSADIVFETVVEGGITRLLALYKAPRADMGNIGSVRSARVVFAELAASMNAVYFYHGQDDHHFPSRAKALNLPRIIIDSKTNGKRIKNGKASEHTLYTSGESLRKEILSKGYNKDNSSEPWLDFTDSKPVSESSAKKVTVKFNSASITGFTYDEATASYIRGTKTASLKNYFTEKEAHFTNVFVLYTKTYPYGSTHDNGTSCPHTKVELNGGSGYYVTKGGYEKITWSKNGNTTPISFKAEDGTPLSVSAGNSYICIIDKNAANSFTAE